MNNIITAKLFLILAITLTSSCAKETDAHVGLPAPKESPDLTFYCTESADGWRYDYYVYSDTLIVEKVRRSKNSTEYDSIFLGAMVATSSGEILTVRALTGLTAPAVDTETGVFAMKIDTNTLKAEATFEGIVLNKNSLECVRKSDAG